MDLCNCFLTYEELENKRIHLEIEKLLKQEKRESLKCYKLLLLGTGEAGKSTFIKQMRIIHGKGFCEDDCKAYIEFVHQNIMNSMYAIIEAMKQFNIPFHGKRRYLDRIISANSRSSSFAISQEQFKVIRKLWHDKGIQEAYRRRNEYQLSDSTSYFMSRLDIISKTNYIPTVQDILHVRVPTTGIVEHKFHVNNIDFQMIDVGGQRSERRKWLHFFDNVTSVIFLASLSEYDQKLSEDQTTNRLKESLELYRGIVGNPWFEQASIILFLNKKDLLEEKIKYSHLEHYFPSFTGPKRNVIAAQKYILSLFAEVNAEHFINFYSHFTCATDTKNSQVVFESVKDTILKKNLSSFNFL